MKNIILAFVLVSFANVAYPQKKTPDQLNGFRDFDLLAPISNYFGENYIQTSDSTFSFNPDNNSQAFLETTIQNINILTYNKKIYAIEVNVEDNIIDLLFHLFTDEYNCKIKDNSNSEDDLLGIEMAEDCTIPLDSKFEITRFEGKDNRVIYYENGLEEKNKGYTLRVEIKDYKKVIAKNLVKEHYKSYMSDFGSQHKIQHIQKDKYIIPLFQKGDSYYLKTSFNNITEYFVFDTGADIVSISYRLYNSLKSNHSLKETEIFKEITVANGMKYKMRKVILKNIQIFDLFIPSIEAYVNTSNNINLLGQSVLQQFGKIEVDNNTNTLTITR